MTELVLDSNIPPLTKNQEKLENEKLLHKLRQNDFRRNMLEESVFTRQLESIIDTDN